MKAVPRRLSGAFHKVVASTSNKSGDRKRTEADERTGNTSRKRKAPELELEIPDDVGAEAYEQKENNNVDRPVELSSKPNKRRHTEADASQKPFLNSPEDLWALEKMFRHEGLLQAQMLSPKIRSVIARTQDQSQSGQLFMLSPAGNLEKVPSRSAAGGGGGTFRFTAKELRTSGVQRKRARLKAPSRAGNLFRARQLNHVKAKDSSIRDCTALEMEEHSKQQLLTLSATQSTTTGLSLTPSSVTPGGLGSFTAPALPLQGGTASDNTKAAAPLLSESQSIIGGAIAEAAKQSNSAEKKKKESNASSNPTNPAATNSVSIPSLSQTQPSPVKFQFGTTTTSSAVTGAASPMPNFQAGLQSSGGGGAQPPPAALPNFNAPSVGGLSLGTAGAAPRVGAKSASGRRKGRRKR